MNIKKNQIELIQKQFATMQTTADLASLLSEAKSIMYGENAKPVELKSITFYANPKKCKNRYSQFSVKKKSGGVRTINAPVSGLKTILRALNLVLQCMYEPHKAATGFVVDKSIVDNAKMHVGNKYVFNIDLKDFFHSFDQNRVKLALMSNPFNLKGDLEPLAYLMANLCTHPFEVNGKTITVLPQGSPTSPTLTNMICQKLDRRLSGLAKRFSLKYSRYADDITFSSHRNVFSDSEFLTELERIIAEDNLLKFKNKSIEIGPQLKINPSKTRLQHASYSQEVTGLIVNDKVNVRKRYVKQLRMWLYYWEKYGYNKALGIFKKDYSNDRGHVKKGTPDLANVIDGKLQFLKMVKGENDATFISLRKRFDKLNAPNNPLNEVLEVWEKEGIEKAMNIYYKSENSDPYVVFTL